MGVKRATWYPHERKEAETDEWGTTRYTYPECDSQWNELYRSGSEKLWFCPLCERTWGI